MELSGRVESLEDIAAIDEMVQEILEKSLEKEKTCFQLKAGIYKSESESIFVERCEDLLK